MRCPTQCKEMGPVDVNGGVHTARKQHQRKNVRICARVASRVLCGLGLSILQDKLRLGFQDEKLEPGFGSVPMTEHGHTKWVP